MKLDFALFEPGAAQNNVIRLILSFCEQHQQSSFTIKELLQHREIAANAKAVKTIRDWLRADRQLVALGDLLLGRDKQEWRCERLIPGTATFYAVRLMPEATKKFGDRVVPSDNPEFISMVYSGRTRLLGKPETAVKPSIRDFVKERLSRCGLETLAADIGSISEIWDIFDDYDFQELMGRKP